MPQKRKLWLCHHKFAKIHFVDSKYVFVRHGNFHQKCLDSMFLQLFTNPNRTCYSMVCCYFAEVFLPYNTDSFKLPCLLIVYYFITWFLNCTRFQNHFRCHIRHKFAMQWGDTVNCFRAENWTPGRGCREMYGVNSRYTLFLFFKKYLFPTEAEYSYFSADSFEYSLGVARVIECIWCLGDVKLILEPACRHQNLI